MHTFLIMLQILYVVGFCFASLRDGFYVCDTLRVSDRSYTAAIAMTFGVALLWPAIAIEDVIRNIIAIETGVKQKAWDNVSLNLPERRPTVELFAELAKSKRIHGS